MADDSLPPTSQALPLLLSAGAAALIGYQLGRLACRAHNSRSTPIIPAPIPPADTDIDPTDPTELRNAALQYRSIGSPSESYPPWIRALKGKSGVYVIRETQRDGSDVIVYVGESHTDRLYHTLTRHFQTWRRSKKFWTGQYGGQGHDPGLTYPRARVTVAVRVLPTHRAIEEEARLIARLRPRDNLLGQPIEDLEEVIPF